MATKEDQEGEAPDQALSELVEEASDTAAPPESESSRESHGSDSDSDGPILYTDDDDDDDDDENASTESKHPAQKLQAAFCRLCFVSLPDLCWCEAERGMAAGNAFRGFNILSLLRNECPASPRQSQPETC